MSTTVAGTMSIVEHVVFFKVKEETPEEKKVAMVRELNALKSLEGVLHLKAGPALRIWPSHHKLSGGFTHVLHSRYSDKAGLSAYSAHPSHVSVVEKFVKPIAEDILAMDWEARVAAPLETGFGAKRVVACKLKDDPEKNRGKLVDRLAGKTPASAGVNFSPGRAKGFNFGILSLVGSVDELENPEILEGSLGSNPQVESLIVLDYASGDERAESSESSAKM
ncbi:stress-response A/B barrel domain-containing protein UP3-like [Selaginella moellendorffii]|uniref:stress-response A/B barrel domain-containing protein UP3-like n=1 Tax=Selaginella moellendorffii TaxID=88036 RepID=UPI000D1C62BF|nr:stress-response A/B barrel domain-containing protein UP3-like [Selaginella moellendorffii]|eukprot:XP_024540804.1 stress-response A/B barrel domain-containing protein UP3-like [Selaginella moellendorffii]